MDQAGCTRRKCTKLKSTQAPRSHQASFSERVVRRFGGVSVPRNTSITDMIAARLFHYFGPGSGSSGRALLMQVEARQLFELSEPSFSRRATIPG